MENEETNKLLGCPFCGKKPRRMVVKDILIVQCSQCVSVGFRNHIRFGCLADAKWNGRHHENG